MNEIDWEIVEKDNSIPDSVFLILNLISKDNISLSYKLISFIYELILHFEEGKNIFGDLDSFDFI